MDHTESNAPAVMTALAEADALFDELIDQQRKKVLRLAREAVPDITPDDVLNPHDFPELKLHQTFEYEDGILSGYIAAQIALRARVIAPRRWAGEAPPHIPGT